MNYIKKMCILRQVRQGFSGDGKALSGLVKMEQYGKNLAVEVSIINFAPLTTGEYYCLLSDGKGKTEMLSLRGKSLFNLLSDLDISAGFCAVVCYVKNEITPIAYGINGNGSYDWRAILNSTLPPVFPRGMKEQAFSQTVQNTTKTEDMVSNQPQDTPPMSELNIFNAANNQKELKKQTQPDPSPTKTPYDDERVVTEDYYQKEQEYEQDKFDEIVQNARIESATEKQNEEKGANAQEDGDADCVLHPIALDPDGYYLHVKAEIDEFFAAYPRDNTLNGAFSCSEWVRVKGTENSPQYLVGILYEDGKAKYICYALAAEDKNIPPDEIKNVCSFVPVSALKQNEGFFVIFQSAATGECVKPKSI